MTKLKKRISDASHSENPSEVIVMPYGLKLDVIHYIED